MSVGLQGQRVAVPVVNVTKVEVRGSRTRKGVGGLIGTLLGAVGGRSLWTPNTIQTVGICKEWEKSLLGFIGPGTSTSVPA